MPAAQLQRHPEAVVRAPVPHHRVWRGAIAGPVNVAPQRIDHPRQRGLARLEPLPRGDEPHHQEGRLHDIAAIVAGREGDGRACRTMHPVREGTAVARCIAKEAANPCDPLHRLAARQEAALGAGDHRHDAEAGAPRRHRLHHAGRAGAFARHAAHRVGEVGEIAQRLALHAVQQAVRSHFSHVTVSDCTSRALAPTMMMNSPGSQSRTMASSDGPRS